MNDTGRANLSPSGDRISLLWRRIKEHRIAQWTVSYVAVAYGIQHAVILTSESFEWPNLVARTSMLLLALGLPLAMTFAWYHGDSANRRVSGAELSIISILLVGVAILFYVFVRPSAELAAGPAALAQASAVTGAPGAKLAGISVAVLPFGNLSADAEQEFFSDGMTEEITSALAKVPDLQVVARASAFQFKGQQKDMRAVGQALGARYLIDGSVRKAGSRVRITAQLIRADSGVNVWSDSYDRELTDVFTIQEDIAQAIAGALRVPLGLQQGETLVSNRTGDFDSYQQYLRARALFRARAIPDAIGVLEPIIARDPNYAPAWALLARAYGLAPVYTNAYRGSAEEGRRAQEAAIEKMELAARKAIQLDSRQAIAYAALGSIQERRGKWAAAEDLYHQAIALDPVDPEVLDNYSDMLLRTGRLKDSLSAKERLRTLEPFVPGFNLNLASAMLFTGQNAASIPILQAISPDGPLGFVRNAVLAAAYAEEGRYAEAANTLLLITGTEVSRKSVQDAANLLRTAPAKPVGPLPDLGLLNFVYPYVGAPSHFLDDYQRRLEIGGAAQSQVWAHEYAPERKTERFKKLVRAYGLVDYWRARGWPDLCRSVGADDFVCN